MRVVIVARQLGHSWSAAAHEAQARKWLHGPKRTVRGASASMQIVQRRRSSSASFSRLTSASAPAVASVAALSALRPPDARVREDDAAGVAPRNY